MGRAFRVLSLLIYVAPYVLGIVLVVALFSAFADFRRARRAPYYRIRRDSSRGGWRWVLIGVACVAGLYGVLSIRGSYGPPDLENLFPTTPPEDRVGTLDLSILTTQPNGTPAATRDPLLSPPTITPTQPPTTPSVTPFITTIEAPVTTSPDATITLETISTGISSSLEPVDAGTFFSSGQPRIYFFISFSNMSNGQSWARALLLDGTVIRTVTEAWNQGVEGNAYYWFEAAGGFPQGSYEAQFYVGDKLVAKGAFTLR
jgi:hypothetical protein